MKNRKFIYYFLLPALAALAAIISTIPELLHIVGFSPADEKKADEKNRGFFYAVKRGDAVAVNTALNNGANPNAKDENDIPVLWWAAIPPNGIIIDMLEGAGADGDLGRSDNPLLSKWAEFFGNDEIVNALMSGANVNAANEYGKTALMWATTMGNGEFVNFLIAAGADVDAKDKDGSTALRWAALQGHGEIANTLIETGADVNALDKDERTALWWAEFGLHTPEGVKKKEEYQKTIAILKDAGARMCAIIHAYCVSPMFGADMKDGVTKNGN